MALSIIGNVQWFDGNISVIFEELQEAKAAPQTPPKLELKSKKNRKLALRKKQDGNCKNKCISDIRRCHIYD